jgi:hypothetical protein
MMGEIYRNASVTIAAARAERLVDGIFHLREGSNSAPILRTPAASDYI